MSIMAIVLSLVGPLTIRMIDRAQAQSELISFKNTLQRMSYLSFARATEHSLIFENQQVTLKKADKVINQSTFDYLSLGDQSLTFNSRGYPSPEILTIELPSRSVQVNIFRLVEGVDAQVSQ